MMTRSGKLNPRHEVTRKNEGMFPRNLSAPPVHRGATLNTDSSPSFIFPQARRKAVDYFGTASCDYAISRFKTGATILT